MALAQELEETHVVTWWVPKTRGTFLGVPEIGAPYFGKLPLCFFSVYGFSLRCRHLIPQEVLFHTGSDFLFLGVLCSQALNPRCSQGSRYLVFVCVCE